MTETTKAIGPHQDQPVVAAGRPLGEATAAVVMVHGRGATAESILELAHEFGHPELAYVAPQAAGYTWYPYSFMAPMRQNEPYLSSALARIGEVLELLERRGHSAGAHGAPGLLAGGLPVAGVRGSERPALWRRGGALGRSDRPGRYSPGL